MHKDEFILRLKNGDTLKLTKDDVNTILADYSSNPDKIFNCDLSYIGEETSNDFSILGAIISFVDSEQDLISNPTFLLALKDPESLNKPAQNFASGTTLTPLGVAIENDKTEIVDKLLK